MKKPFFKITAIIVFIFTINVNCKAQVDYSNLIENYRKEILKKMKKNNIVGASIALFDGDSIIWKEGFGYANKEKEIKVTPNTEFGIGSITKLFTGTAIMQLHEEGILDIDNPVSTTFPKFHINSRFGPIEEITIRNVMTHTAGLPSDIVKGMFSENPESYFDELKYLKKEYTIFKPNTVFAYSNPGYNLLGCIVEDISNIPYKDYINDKIFDKIGMNNSYFDESEAIQLSEAYNSKGKLVQEIPIRCIPAGYIKSNVLDLSKFFNAFMNNKESLIKDHTFSEMTKVQFDKMYFGKYQKIGLTWFIEEHEGYSPMYGHGGATLYQQAIADICPEHNLGIVILTNSNSGNSVCRLYSDILKKAIDIKSGNSPSIDKKPKIKIEKTAIDKSDLELWTGNYAAPGLIYEVNAKNNKLTTSVQGTKIDLIYTGNNEFLPVAKLLGFIPFKMKSTRFAFESSGEEVLIFQKNIKRNRLSVIGQKYEKQEISPEWKNRIGTYTIINSKEGDYSMIDKFEIVEVDGTLVLKTTVMLEELEMDLGLGIISDSHAYVLGLGRNGGYSITVEKDNNGDELIYCTGYLLKKVNN